jgi:putative peptidoglycan lipid II flippase
MIRSAVASFYSRHDTATPLIASFTGIGVNLALKLLLFRTHGAAGLAFATAIGAWTNVGLLVLLASRRGWMAPDRALKLTIVVVAAACVLMAGATLAADPTLKAWASALPVLHAEAHVGALAVVGLAAYGLAVLAGFKALRLSLVGRG